MDRAPFSAAVPQNERAVAMQKRQLDLALDDAIRQAPQSDDALRAPIWTSKGRRRSCAPVRRKSGKRGRCEGVFWRPVRRSDLRIMVRAAERMELTARIAGKRNGPLGHIGLEVLKVLVDLVDYSTGQLDPSYAEIAARCRRSRSAVAEGLARLREAGFLDWLRRFDDDPAQAGERGPQIKQVSNAYRFVMPAFIARLLGFQGQGVPLPEDDEDRRRDQRKMVERWEYEASPLYAAIERANRAFGRE